MSTTSRTLSLHTFRQQAGEFVFGEAHEYRSPGSLPDVRFGKLGNTIEFSGFASLVSGHQMLELIDQHTSDAPDTEVLLVLRPQYVRVCIAHP